MRTARLAERAGLRTHHLPVGRAAPPGSARDRRSPARGTLPPGPAAQLLRFAAVGAASTLGYLLLYTTLRPAAGPQAANAVALLATALANTAANRRLTFGVRGRGGAIRHQAKGLVAFLTGLALTSGSLAAMHHAAPAAGHRAELTLLLAANLGATLLRFLLFRAWVFPARPACHTTGSTAS